MTGETYMPGESKFRGVIGDYDTGKLFIDRHREISANIR